VTPSLLLNGFRIDSRSGFYFNRKYTQTSNIADDNSDLSRAPYLQSLKIILPKIKHQFFFPGHRSGNCAPSQLLTNLIGKEALQFDLPELDGLDNIHNPEVLFKEVFFYMIISLFIFGYI